MKKCPKCKAEIEENARFCLYCMTSFEEKQSVEVSKENKKLWMYIVTAVFVLVLIVLGVFLLVPKDKAEGTSNQNSRVPSVSSEPNNFNDNKNTVQSDKPSSSEKENSSANKTSSGSSTVSSGSSSSSGGSASSDKAEGSSSTTNSSTTTPSQTTTVDYMCRDAKYGDDFSVSANLENAVVITGVKNASADGKYIIPETIGGKKVVAIMGLAFCDDNISSTVKTVIVPSSVKTIWNNAFANCYNLTDIYFKGNSIYTESNAFPEKSKRSDKLTIHCSANCSDRNYRYYKSSASYYDAEYKEWNG